MGAPSEPAKSCRHLVSLRDPATFFAYPSPMNGCGRFEPPGCLPGSHQSSYCLTVRHASCPLLAHDWTAPFPEKLERVAENEWAAMIAGSRRRWWPTAFGGLAVVGVAAVLWWTAGTGFDGASPDQSTYPDATVLVVQPTLVPSATSEALPLPLPAPSATPLPTLPPMTPTAGPNLETAFGAEPSFLIHSIQAGDSLFALGEQFGASAEAIRSANNIGDQPLAIGQLLVIPLGVYDPAVIPAFVILQIGESSEPLADLAARYGADPEAIRRYNALGEDPMLPPGRWLIVPAEQAR